MSRYQMSDGTVVDTDNATKCWKSIKEADEVLYRSRRGRYWLLRRASQPDAWPEWLSPERAAAWLLMNNHDLPEKLQTAATRVTE
jgi:hypothetical protein